MNSELLLLKKKAVTDNAEIEKKIAASSPRLRMVEDGKISAALPRFLLQKRRIDTAIFEDERISPVEAEIAGMVADLSRAWLADLEKLASGSLNEKERLHVVSAVWKGLKVMDKTQTEIDTLIRPAHDLTPVVESIAADRAQRLEDRVDEARSIRDRLVRDLKDSDVPANPEENRLTQ